MALPQTPPLLLTKRLSTFLTTHKSPALPTLLLATPHGKVLAHASPHPVSSLRTHATVAANLLSMDESDEEEDDEEDPQQYQSPKNATITVRGSGSTVLMRRLACGLLFVAIGPKKEGEHKDGEDEAPNENGKGMVEEDVGEQSETAGDSVVQSGDREEVVEEMVDQMTELSKWLDDKLGTLAVPIEGVGGD